MDALSSCDPLPPILLLLETLQQGADGSEAIAEHGVKVKNVFKRARTAAQGIEHADVNVEEQAEIIMLLEARNKAKASLATRLTAAIKALEGDVKDESRGATEEDGVQDIVMTEG
jgi:hypothetical protein